MSTTATAYEVGHLYEVDPGALKIGTNVRVDTRSGAKDFAASIKARGVVEAITAHVDAEGGLTVLRGQRRTIVATKVGTPSGTVPVRVVPGPEEADRIVDQMTENIHREAMSQRETRDGIEQLALLGVSAAQIAKRTALPRPTVDASLAVTANPATKERMDDAGMTLEEALIFAEFEDHPAAIATLTSAWEDPRQRTRIGHIVQRLRDDLAEAQALLAEVERLRAQGLPVLDPQDAPSDIYRHALANLNTEDGAPVPEEQWPTIAGAAVVVVAEWRDPEDIEQPTDDSADVNEDGDDEPRYYEPAEPVLVYEPVWVCIDPEVAGLHHFSTPRRGGRDSGTGREGPDERQHVETDEERAAREAAEAAEEARREAERAERRRVIANNKEWKAAQVVRREWLAGFLTRRTVPNGAETLIAKAVIGREYTLSHAMQHGHSLLPDLLGVKPVEGTVPAYYGNTATCARIIEQSTTPKAAILRTLAAIVAAWEERSGTHTWRNPRPWDATIMSALMGWGYPASEVEQLLTPSDSSDGADDEQDDPSDDAGADDEAEQV